MNTTGTIETASATINIVSGRPGIRDRSKPLRDVVKNARELSYPSMPLPEYYQENIRHLSESARGHQITDTGIMLSVIVFPVHEPNHPKLVGISLQRATSAKTKPLLCSGACDQTQRMMIALYGDEHTLDENVYASIAPFRGKRVLCLVPENHQFERQILACLDIEQTPMGRTRERVFFQTKVFGKGGSYTQSRCQISHPMFRLWFPRESCGDIRAQINDFYPDTATTPRQRAPKNTVPAPRGVTKVSASTSSPAAKGKGLTYVRDMGHGKGLHPPGAGKRLHTPGKCLMSPDMVGKTLPSSDDTFQHFMQKINSIKPEGSIERDWKLAYAFVPMLREVLEERTFVHEMFPYWEMEPDDLVVDLAFSHNHIAEKHGQGLIAETMAEIEEVLNVAENA